MFREQWRGVNVRIVHDHVGISIGCRGHGGNYQLDNNEFDNNEFDDNDTAMGNRRTRRVCG